MAAAADDDDDPPRSMDDDSTLLVLTPLLFVMEPSLFCSVSLRHSWRSRPNLEVAVGLSFPSWQDMVDMDMGVLELPTMDPGTAVPDPPRSPSSNIVLIVDSRCSGG